MAMKKFKDQVKDDFAIFFNLEEFGEIHKVEGKEIESIFMVDSHGSTSMVSDKDLKNTGLTGADFTLYLKREDCDFKHSAGKILNVDGKELVISKVAEEMGVLIFNLHQYRRY